MRQQILLDTGPLVALIERRDRYHSWVTTELATIQPPLLIKKEKNITNVEPVRGSVTDPNLPTSSVDLALMVDAYHEFSYPREI